MPEFWIGTYSNGKQTPLSVQVLNWLIKLLWQRSNFIHELQLEPWGPKAIWEMDIAENMAQNNLSSNQVANLAGFIHALAYLLAVIMPFVLIIWPSLSYVAIIFVAVVFAQWVVFRGCSLTQIERKYRKLDDPKTDFNDQSFLQYYLYKFFKVKIAKNVGRSLVFCYLLIILYICWDILKTKIQ